MARGTTTTYSCTAEDIVRERDERRQSWAKVAEVLGLKSPSAARAAYTALTGRPHTDSEVKVHRAAKGQGPRAQKAKAEASPTRQVDSPNWSADSDQDEIIARLEPKWHHGSKGEKVYDYMPRIVVERQRYHEVWREDITIAELRGFQYNKDESRLWIELYQHNGAFRCVYVDDIKEVV